MNYLNGNNIGDCTKCKLCPFRFVCPPVSIFEIQSNQIKMCHINYNEL